MKELARMVIVLTCFCLVAGIMLAWANGVTRDPIDKAKRAEMAEALQKVLPECDNDVLADARTVKEGDGNWTFYVARKNGKPVGIAFKSHSNEGYGGRIEVLVGVTADGTVRSVEIIEAKETPGLGSKIAQPEFRKQFKGKPASDLKWAALQKDGGEINGITSATISSRALTKAVKTGLEVYAKHAAELTAPATE